MASLNEAQRNSIRTAYKVLSQRLAEIEGLIATGSVASPLAEHVPDLSPAEARVIGDYASRLRAVMLANLEAEEIPLDGPRTSLRWAVECSLMSLAVLIDEMGARKLRQYGPLDDEGRARAEKVREDVRRLVERLAAYLRRGQGRDLDERLARLEREGRDVEALARIERVVARWHLVEFRPTVEMILSRLESPRFEVAVFGRVSSGKSSLLNAIAGRDALPVGVTPVTTVPTRLEGGPDAGAVVTFADRAGRSVPLEELWRYASEEGNPANVERVTSITVTLPSPRLGSGVTFVDTPGVGSLATSGSAETLAYLPRADLGVVLVDAASTLNEEDLRLLGALHEAGIPAMVLLSKVDLISEADRGRLIRYMEDRLGREFESAIQVRAVSTVGTGRTLLDRWFEEELGPRLESHRSLAEASLRRKVGHLRESVADALRTLAARASAPAGPGAAGDVVEARRQLEAADAAIRQFRAEIAGWAEGTRRLLDQAMDRIAAEAQAAPDGALSRGMVSAMGGVLRERAAAAHGQVEGLKQTLGGALRASGLLGSGSIDVAEDVVAGLPPPDLGRLGSATESLRIPSWARVAPWLRRWWIARELSGPLGDEIEEAVGVYDRRLHAWVSSESSRIIASYEGQAEAAREQIRRLSAAGGGAELSADDLAEIRKTLEELG